MVFSELKKKAFLFFLLVLAFLPTGGIYAWWDMGHMVVAKIAYDRLRPEIKEKLDKILIDSSAEFPESATFVTAACFADDIKDRGFCLMSCYHGSNRPYDPEGILSQNEKKLLAAVLKNNDIIYAIDGATKTLKNPNARTFEKSLALRLLIHYVGDIHQPLHCTTLYTKSMPKGDCAGTRFPIVKPDGEKTSLHLFWDSILALDAERIVRPLNAYGIACVDRFVQLALSELDVVTIDHAQNMCIDDWAKESYKFGTKISYAGIVPNAVPSSEYIDCGRKVALRRLAIAGLRLATLLNQL